jgi:hypothetical protein
MTLRRGEGVDGALPLQQPGMHPPLMHRCTAALLHRLDPSLHMWAPAQECMHAVPAEVSLPVPFLVRTTGSFRTCACSPPPPLRVARGSAGRPSALRAMVAWLRRSAATVAARWRVGQLQRGAFAPVRVDPDTDDDTPPGPGGHHPHRDLDEEAGPAAARAPSAPPLGATAGPAAGLGQPEAAGDGGAVDCVICMTEVVIAERDYMVTPCNHVFHDACLRQWLDVKLECPTCRAALPTP